MKKLPNQLNLALLEFLEHGDYTRIASIEKKAGYKTSPSYVGQVCKGIYRNSRILAKAMELAVQNKAKYPRQAITEPA